MNWLDLVFGVIFALVAIFLGILSVHARMYTVTSKFTATFNPKTTSVKQRQQLQKPRLALVEAGFEYVHKINEEQLFRKVK